MTSFPKALKISGITVGGILVLAVVIYGAVSFANHQNSPAEQGQQTCKTTGNHKTYKVVIQHDKAQPAHTAAQQCDTLTITNLDDEQRLVAFGPHEDHVPYDGVAERTLNKGQSLTVTLVQAGNFRFHDHIHDEVQGTFTVTSK